MPETDRNGVYGEPQERAVDRVGANARHPSTTAHTQAISPGSRQPNQHPSQFLTSHPDRVTAVLHEPNTERARRERPHG